MKNLKTFSLFSNISQDDYSRMIKWKVYFAPVNSKYSSSAILGPFFEEERFYK